MSKSTKIWITTAFEGFHRWKDAPNDVSFLRDFHRHIFHVKAEFKVTQHDRELEFFQLQRDLVGFIRKWCEGAKFDLSCEAIAEVLLLYMLADAVEVSEDGENGARVEKTACVSPASVAYQCFVGIEAEGPHRGAKTLFVPGTVTPEDFQRAFRKVDWIERVYYGAGNNRLLREDTFLEIVSEGITVVEVDALASVPFQLDGAAIVSLSLQDAHKVKWVKTVGNSIRWEDGNSVWVTKLDDPLYNRDIFVE